jgi:hypothetical protein
MVSDQVCIPRAVAEEALACVLLLATDEREPERYRVGFAKAAAEIREALGLEQEDTSPVPEVTYVQRLNDSWWTPR